jgi:hypothetical protein
MGDSETEGLILVIAMHRALDFLVGVQAFFALLWRSPQRKLQKCDFEEGAGLIGDPLFSARLLGHSYKKGAKISGNQIYWLGEGDQSNYTPGPENSLAEMARSRSSIQ